MTIYSIVFLLIVATLTALVARRLHTPYTVGLALVGMALTFLHLGGHIILTRHLLYDALLPPLLFEGAISISWQSLKRDALPIATLASVGVAISSLTVAAGMHYFAHWSWANSFIFGALIAATDPVSALATFKETGVTGRLRLLVESESLLNDGVAAVLFTLAVSYATAVHGASLDAPRLFASLIWEVAGGIAIGVAIGGAAVGLAGRPSADHLVETALTATAAYGSFLLAQHVGASGVLAAVAAGLVVGNVGALQQEGSRYFSERGREVAEAFWEFAAFVANSLVFLLIGLGNARLRFVSASLAATAIAIVLVWIGRAVSVYPLCALFAKSRLRISGVHQHALFWGGLRGALALALALSLPAAISERGLIQTATFGVVAFSVIVQGIALPLWLRHWNLLPPSAPSPEGAEV